MQNFNSRNTNYKSKISAIANNEKVKLRIIVPRSMTCSDAYLAIHKDKEDTVFYKMFWAGMCGNDNEYWELHFYATTPGLYFYHFELDTPWGRVNLSNAGNGIGTFDASGKDFQQTVYDENFKTPDFIKGGIIYQIFPDRFCNSGEKKENVPQSRVMRKWGEEPYWNENQNNGQWNNDYFGGDLKGIENKLDYIKSLGVSCIYLNPIFEANSNHRYDTADYEKIDSLLGSEKDLKSLCKKAKSMGISIILDGVFSHTGSDSKYFNKFNKYDDVGAYNSPNSPYFNWYKFVDYPNEYQSWWGIKSLPEVIEENNNYRSYICGENGILRKWLKCGISGWRLDVADELPDIFLDDLRKTVKDENENAVIIGEVWEDATNKFAYGQRRRYLLGEQLDSVMNYPFANAILDFVKYGDSMNFYNSIMTIVENYPPCVLNALMNHIGTHDTQRAITRLAGENVGDKSRYWQHDNNYLSSDNYKKGVLMMKMASLIQFTLPGVPSVYYGDEVGMQGMKDPFNRACYPWGKEDKELLNWYRNLGKLRRNTSAFKGGSFEFIYTYGNTVAYTRKDEFSEVLVGVNNSDKFIKIEVDEKWNDSKNYFSDKPFNNLLTISPKSFVLLIK